VQTFPPAQSIPPLLHFLAAYTLDALNWLLPWLCPHSGTLKSKHRSQDNTSRLRRWRSCDSVWNCNLKSLSASAPLCLVCGRIQLKVLNASESHLTQSSCWHCSHFGRSFVKVSPWVHLSVSESSIHFLSFSRCQTDLSRTRDGTLRPAPQGWISQWACLPDLSSGTSQARYHLWLNQEQSSRAHNYQA